MLRFIPVLFALVLLPLRAQTEFDTLRERWVEMLTGGSSYSLTDPEIAAAVTSINSTAATHYASMNKSPSRTALWSDKAGVRNSPNIKETYRRLRSMALAYRTHGAALEGDPALLADLISAMDWMYTNCYNEVVPTPSSSASSNWWDWQIGIALSVNDITALLYAQLTSTQVSNYMTAVASHTDEVGKSGANRSWQMIIVGITGILTHNADFIVLARDGFHGTNGLFTYRTTGEGYYTDGTFNQHTLPYNGGYGVSCLTDMTNLITLLEGSTWAVTDPSRANYTQFLHDSYQALMHRGAMMDVFRGREISRENTQDHVIGHLVISAFLRAASIVPPADALTFRRLAKTWITTDTFRSYIQTAPLPGVLMAKPILANSSITTLPTATLAQAMPRADRLVVQRQGFAFALGLFSTRYGNYEAINSENNRGWYTSSGTTYLYNGDIEQFSGNYWPTVDSYRLPGITVTSQTRPCLAPLGGHGTVNQSAWAGSIDLLDTYASAGMELDYPALDSAGNPRVSLTAKKSWFVFDDEIIALGAGINSTDSIPIETVVENRRLSPTGNEVFTVNGTAQSTVLGWTQTLGGVTRAHLAGAAAGTDIGYVFPTAVTLNASRTARTDKWYNINKNGPNTNVTCNYLTFWLDHGSNPVNQTYSYAILPNFTSAQVNTYAANPSYTVLQNSTTAQAVQEVATGLIGANFWNDGPSSAGWITVDKKSIVLARERDGVINVSVADPTHLNTGLIQVELNRPGIAQLSVDPGVTVTQLTPTIKFSIAVSGARGGAFRASFSTAIIVDNLDAGATITGSWNNNGTEPDHYGADYLYDGNSGKGLKNVVFRPNIPVAGTYAVSMMWADASNRASNAPVDVVHNGTTEPEILVDQKNQGGQWVPLGSYQFAAGTTGYVRIRNTNTTGVVVADAVRFVKVP